MPGRAVGEGVLSVGRGVWVWVGLNVTEPLGVSKGSVQVGNGVREAKAEVDGSSAVGRLHANMAKASTLRRSQKCFISLF